jgi:hypothetical protein
VIARAVRRFRRYGRPPRLSLQLRYRRASAEGGAALWEPQTVTVAELRTRGLRAYPSAVGVWWPHPRPGGAFVCGGCLATRDASAGRAGDEEAIVLFGEGARRRVDTRCVVHVVRVM